MTLADKVTSLRIVLAPVFCIIYLFPVLFPAWPAAAAPWTVPVLGTLFIIAELTDLLDGQIARRRHEVGDFGKLFDPFADVLVRVSYFLCFVVTGILPVLPFLLVLYREFGILFLRLLMMKRGIAMGARWGGKIKAVLYMAAGALALIAVSLERLGLDTVPSRAFRLAAVVIFYVSVLISLLSFADYIMVYRRAIKTGV
ncbi:CDP-diacylglycerol--glycerol-3-phosphate 3-phosphatidyltransferase [Spirochaetia bacterium]|nr:CDP-diacylglycerol--glycerol-3-phosphate 3-phosphatidyltransferase [Spirochaetia bacterium]